MLELIDPGGNIVFYFPHKIREMCPWAKLLLAEGFPLVLICYLDKQGLYIWDIKVELGAPREGHLFLYFYKRMMRKNLIHRFVLFDI